MKNVTEIHTAKLSEATQSSLWLATMMLKKLGGRAEIRKDELGYELVHLRVWMEGEEANDNAVIIVELHKGGDAKECGKCK